jgi:response regulator RpfG family c-di-GMP phosphodiesterase
MHHENDEGSGYPAGIASPEVTRNAKLLSLADRYCAQVSARNYRSIAAAASGAAQSATRTRRRRSIRRCCSTSSWSWAIIRPAAGASAQW